MRYRVVVWLAMVGLAHAQAKDPWIGKRVFTKEGTVLKVENRVVDDERRTADFHASGKARKESRVYRVEHTNGEWLWLQDEKSGACGWVQARFVIPHEQAIDHFTKEIRDNPGAAHYIARGNIWVEAQEYDIAIADYGDAIRLDPNDPLPFSNRGLAWGLRKDHDRAIADFSEAIRLEPKFASAYYNRGGAWDEKKEYDRAIADYNEAIRLEPKYAFAYYSRGMARRHKKEYDRAIADYNEAIRLEPKDADPYNARAWLWATCPDEKIRDGKKAVASATRASELSAWRDANHLDTLAASYAEFGDFDRAVKWEEAAMKLITAPQGEELKGAGERLALYRVRKPYREPPTVAEAPTDSKPVARRVPPEEPTAEKPGTVASLKRTTLYVPTSEFESRFGTDPKPMDRYVLALSARVNAILAEAEPPSAKGLLVAVGIKSRGRTRAWCQAVEGQIPEALVRTLERELGEVPGVDLEQAPAGFGLEFGLFGQSPAKFPEVPDRWRDAAASGRSKKVIPPDDLFRILWAD